MRHILTAIMGVLFAVVLATMIGCASSGKPAMSGPDATGNTVSQRVSVAAGDVYEECFELKAGQSLFY